MSAFYEIVHPVMPLEKPEAGFYYWAKTPMADTEFSRLLLSSAAVAVLPGSLLARTAHRLNPGQDRIRIALVGSLEETLEAATRLVNLITSLQDKSS